MTTKELADLIFPNITKTIADYEAMYPERDLKEGMIADIAIIDINNEETYVKEDIVSMGKNSPFIGNSYYGFNKMTFVKGKVVYKK